MIGKVVSDFAMSTRLPSPATLRVSTRMSYTVYSTIYALHHAYCVLSIHPGAPEGGSWDSHQAFTGHPH